nr:MAG TPA: hypothetical protein [Caudoviricetes sp.]
MYYFKNERGISPIMISSISQAAKGSTPLPVIVCHH